MRFIRILACSAAIAAMSSTAFAQGQGQGRGEGRQGRPGAGAFQQQQLSPEQLKAIWTWQARDVSHELELNDETTKKVVETYLKAREDFQVAFQKVREEARRQFQEQREAGGGEGRGAGGAGGAALAMNNELIDEHSAALKKKLAEILDEKQVRKAIQPLGTFSRQWDAMTNTIVELKLDEAKAYEASKPVRAYILAIEEARTSGDRESMRDTMMAARETLMNDLGKILTEDQVASFNRRGQRGGEGRGGRGGAGPDIAQAPEPTVAEVGKRAPNFTLTSTAGEEHSLADFKGKNVVLQWINPDCPVCRRVVSTGIVAGMLKSIKELDKDVVYLTINSTNYMDAGMTAAYLKKNDLDVPGLVDRDGKVGKLYDAKTTPHMYIIDKEGILRYNGAIDDDQAGRNSNATNFVVQAMRQIVAGETVSPDTTRPYGCSVKYAAK